MNLILGIEVSWVDYILLIIGSLPMRCGWYKFYNIPSPLISISAFQIFTSIYYLYISI
nr:MAG TPA: hypothetical protein [Caudoviricetes sp.]